MGEEERKRIEELEALTEDLREAVLLLLDKDMEIMARLMKRGRTTPEKERIRQRAASLSRLPPRKKEPHG